MQYKIIIFEDDEYFDGFEIDLDFQLTDFVETTSILYDAMRFSIEENKENEKVLNKLSEIGIDYKVITAECTIPRKESPRRLINLLKKCHQELLTQNISENRKNELHNIISEIEETLILRIENKH